MNCVEEILRKLRDPCTLNEMAIINPQLCKQLGVQVEIEQRDEGPIPHLHVYLDKKRNPRNCAYIRLDKAEYSSHHKHGKKLNREQKDAFIKIMNSLWTKEFIQSISGEEIKQATGFEAAVKIWIDTYGDTTKFEYDDSGFPLIPDYETL